MRKIIMGLLWIIVLITLLVYFDSKNKRLFDETNRLMEIFDNNNLLDASGNVVLSEVKEMANNVKEEVEHSYYDKNIDINEYIEYSENVHNNEPQNEVYNLLDQIEELKNKRDSLKLQYRVLEDKYHSLLNNSTSNDSFIIQNVPTIYQYPKYPTGCESVALTILLNYHGYKVTTDDIIKKLKMGDIPYDDGKITYGGNPELEFIGSPYSPDSYGVYNLPIGNVAAEFSQDVNVQSNFPFSEVLNLVKQNRPVMVWTSMNLAMPYISTSWVYKPTGEIVSWRAQEHAVVIIGYDSKNVIISDPLSGTIKYQDRVVFESRYNYYGKRAVYL